MGPLAGAPGERAAAVELPIPDAEHDDVWWLQFRRRYPTTRAVSTDRSGEDVVVQQSSLVHHVHDS
jgi:hypothetical protein